MSRPSTARTPEVGEVWQKGDARRIVTGDRVWFVSYRRVRRWTEEKGGHHAWVSGVVREETLLRKWQRWTRSAEMMDDEDK